MRDEDDETQSRSTRVRAGHAVVRPDGILQVWMHDVEHDEAGARELLGALRRLVDSGEEVPILIDLTDSGIVERQVGRIFATEGDVSCAQAFLVDSAFTRILANLILRYASAPQPSRLFTSEDEAVRWLRGFLR